MVWILWRNDIVASFLCLQFGTHYTWLNQCYHYCGCVVCSRLACTETV